MGHEAVVKLLLDKDSNVVTKDDEYGRTPLWLAAKKGHIAMVKLLAAKDGEYGPTPLLWAAMRGHYTLARLLLENGAHIEDKDSRYGQTPLSWAAYSGHEAVVQLLLDKSNGNTVDTTLRTPL